MARNRLKTKGRRDGGSFVQFLRHVFTSNEYYKLSPLASALLVDIYMQYNGSNNGDFCIAPKIMRPKGWTSQGQLHKAKKELLEKGWIIETRKGGRNKATLYAVTFWAIDDCKGKLDIKPTSAPLSYWRFASTPEIKVLSPHSRQTLSDIQTSEAIVVQKQKATCPS